MQETAAVLMEIVWPMQLVPTRDANVKPVLQLKTDFVVC